MPDKIAARSCSIEDLFSSQAQFWLPFFQRGYAWQEAHALRLLKDVLEFTEGRHGIPWYPLGTIIVARDEEAGAVWLTDGHQRLLTLTILLAILRDREKDPDLKSRLANCIANGPALGDGAEHRLVTQEKSRRTLADHVQALDATLKDYPGDIEDLPDSEANILANLHHLRRRLHPMAPEVRRRLAEHLLSLCIVVLIEVENQEVARLLFATMHNTGIKPSPADLFKAHVLGAIETASRQAAQSSWEHLEASLGCERMELLLQQIAIIADRRVPEGQVELRLDEVFQLSDPTRAATFIDTRIRPIGRYLARIGGAQLSDGRVLAPITRRIKFLSWVRHGEMWMPPTLHWLDRHGEDKPETLEFLRRIEALAWTQMIRAVEPDQRDQRYMALIDEITAGRALEPGGALTISEVECAETRRILMAPNFIRRKYKQFLLLRIDAALGGPEDPLPPPIGTIEHIFPNRPAANSVWIRDFKGREAAVLRQTLGNLTLLTTPEQDAVKNKDFGDKRLTYRTSVFRLTRHLDTHARWTPAEVEARTRFLVDLIMQDWGIA